MAKLHGLLLFPLASVFLSATGLGANAELAGLAISNADKSQEMKHGTSAFSMSFRWISATRDKALFRKVKTAFAEALRPDARGDAPPNAIHYRYIWRVGVTDNTALVIIGNRNDPKVAAFDFFDVYSFDLRTASAKKIVADTPFYLLRFIALAHFETGKAPDLIFEYKDCVECEPVTLLAAVGLAKNGWSLRNWDMSGNSLGLGGTQDPEGDIVDRIEHAYRIGDLDHTGKDQIAVWIRSRAVAAEDPAKVYSQSISTVVYRLSNETLHGDEILEPSRTIKVYTWICSAPSVGSECKSRF